jgi:type II secretory pathway component PulJ
MIEMVAVMALSGVIIALLGVCVQTVLEVNQTYRNQEQFTAMLIRLDTRFRADVHQAVAARMNDTSDSESSSRQLVLQLPEGCRTVYFCKAGQVVRTESRNGKVTHRDAFRLGPHGRARFQLEQASSRSPYAAIAIETDDRRWESTGKPKASHLIRAVMGLQQLKNGDKES